MTSLRNLHKAADDFRHTHCARVPDRSRDSVGCCSSPERQTYHPVVLSVCVCLCRHCTFSCVCTIVQTTCTTCIPCPPRQVEQSWLLGVLLLWTHVSSVCHASAVTPLTPALPPAGSGASLDPHRADSGVFRSSPLRTGGNSTAPAAVLLGKVGCVPVSIP